MTYYDREVTTHLDGTPVFATARDKANEAATAQRVAEQWGCELHPFGPLAPVDWYAIRDGRLVGVLELKTRSHGKAQYPTVFLNVRKWLALQLAGVGLGVPAIFVARFTDDIRWIDVATVSGNARMGGCARIVKARSDVEPVIEVPVTEMRSLNAEAVA